MKSRPSKVRPPRRSPRSSPRRSPPGSSNRPDSRSRAEAAAGAAAGETVESLTIERLVYGGDGLARREGKAVFVPLSLPGERVRATVVERHAGYDRARLLAIETPSPHRVAPGCEYFTGRADGDGCGGCQWQHVAAEYQVECKAEILREALRRGAGVEFHGRITIYAGPPWEYRNRVRLRVESGPRIGYFRRHSHQLVSVDHCPIAAPGVQAAIAALAEGPPPPPALRELEITCDERGEGLMVDCLAAIANAAARDYAAALASRLSGCRSVALATPELREVVAGGGGLDYCVGDRTYWISHGAFFQANRFLIPALREAAAALPEDFRPGGRCLELFSGGGLFTAALAERFARVAAVENDPLAAADLRRNTAGLAGVEVHEADAAEFMAERNADAGGAPGANGSAEPEDLDLLLADPPRAGLGENLCAAIVAARPRRIRCVSCDPATLARDLRALLAGGYALAGLSLFDLFPQSFHIEAVADLTRA